MPKPLFAGDYERSISGLFLLTLQYSLLLTSSQAVDDHIHVGAEEKFMVHEHALLAASAKLKENVEKEDSKDRGFGLVNMLDEDPDLFSFVLQ